MRSVVEKIVYVYNKDIPGSLSSMSFNLYTGNFSQLYKPYNYICLYYCTSDPIYMYILMLYLSSCTIYV